MRERGLFTRLQELRDKRDEEGVALATIVILSFVILIIASSLSMTLVQSSNLTADKKSVVNTISSAESGVDFALLGAVTNSCLQSGSNTDAKFNFKVYRSSSEEKPTGLSDPRVSPGCPIDGDTYITIESKGTDARGKETELVSTYRWVTRDLGGVKGALISGTGEINISTLGVIGAEGDMLVASGNFDCNSTSDLAGDVIILNGNFKMSNSCRIRGDLYVSGNVQITNATGIDGSVYTRGSFFMTNPDTVIGGDVKALGPISLSAGTRVMGSVTSLSTTSSKVGSAKIGGSLVAVGPIVMDNGAEITGSVVSSSSEPVQYYNVRIGGDIVINGSFAQLQQSRVNGNVSARSNATSSVAPDTVIGGYLRLGGGINTWSSGPQAAGGVQLNKTIALTPTPTFELPEQLQADFFEWRDYEYIERDWTESGYQVVTQTDCDFQNKPSLVSELNNRVIPTVVDLRSCPEIKLYNITLNLRSDLTFIVNHLSDVMRANSNDIKVRSADGGHHEFNMISSDKLEDGKPTCGGGQGKIEIYGINMAPEITSFIYTPCQLRFGGASVFNGQIYSGAVEYAGGGFTEFNYRPVMTPGFPMEEFDPVPTAFDADADSRAMPQLVGRLEK